MGSGKPFGDAALTLTFWFDVHSPWCYLASIRIQSLASKHGHCLKWRPLHLPRLIAAIDGRRPLEENPAFVTWYMIDLQDWAREYGLKVRYHPNYPLRNSRALRLCLYAADEGCAQELVPRVMRAYWSEGADITDLDLLARLAKETGLDATKAREAALSESMKKRIEANTKEAIGRGVFGVPTIDIGDKLYFGNDRLDMLDRHLAARRADPELRRAGAPTDGRKSRDSLK
jgi:2-hydroxychromene-2-carboxylate isomerase